MTEVKLSSPQSLQRAAALLRAGNLAEAERLLRGAIGERPQSVEALQLLGLLAARRGRFDDAENLFARAVALDPRLTAAHLNRGNALVALKRFEEAVASYDRALEVRPDYAEAAFNRANVLAELRRLEEAVASYAQAIRSKPGNADAHCRRANCLKLLNRLPESLAEYDRALALNPALAEGWNNRGVVLKALERVDDAIASYEHAVKIRPEFPEAIANRGLALADQNRHAEAAAEFERLLAWHPDHDYTRGVFVHSRMYCCDWRDFDAEAARLVSDVRAGKRTTHPFPFIAVSDSAEDQWRCARLWATDKCPATASPRWAGERYRHAKIRLAYLSADFHDHATAHLAAGLFERHDRARFETTAVSFGPARRDAMRARLQAAFGRFVDVRDRSDGDVARMLREMEIDIAVDLKGCTKHARPGILAMRPAPVQISYLGYPGTMGATHIDYIIADRHVIPEEHEPFFSEKVVWLPDSYQVNDSTRRIGETAPTRAAAGLPQDAFVFCSFNSSYKITPAVFDVWMRLLNRVPKSVLWLLRGNSAVEQNLRREAAARGIADERLVFADHARPEDHLARHRIADLFLDTLPCNAHTTASDALWAGLPVLTCMGNAFAARVAASLLHAAGLPELVVGSLADYEKLAIALAGNRAGLAELKERLARNRASCALFDTDRFRRHIEVAYALMHERNERGEPPKSFAVGRLAL